MSGCITDSSWSSALPSSGFAYIVINGNEFMGHIWLRNMTNSKGWRIKWRNNRSFIIQISMETLEFFSPAKAIITGFIFFVYFNILSYHTVINRALIFFWLFYFGHFMSVDFDHPLIHTFYINIATLSAKIYEK